MPSIRRNRGRIAPGATRARRPQMDVRAQLDSFVFESRFYDDIERDLKREDISLGRSILLRKILRGGANHQMSQGAHGTS